MNAIFEMSWFVHIFLQIKHMVPIVYTLLKQLFRLLGKVYIFSQPKPCSDGYNL